MSQRVAMTGNEAAANALRQVNPDVAAVYPITPQTELMHKFSGFVADGKVKTAVIYNKIAIAQQHLGDERDDRGFGSGGEGNYRNCRKRPGADVGGRVHSGIDEITCCHAGSEQGVERTH